VIVTKRRLSRRELLRGAAATIALPFLDCMVPAFVSAQTNAPTRRRLGVVYLPNGIRMEHWTPLVEGRNFELTPILEPLRPWRDQLTIVSGLNNGPPHYAVHGAASTRFLTTMPPAASTGTVVEAGVSMDQLVAREFGRTTPLASLELSLESGFSGVCDIGASCVYTDTIAWRGPSSPLPMEHNPRAVFDRLFGDRDLTGPQADSRFGSARSVLDSVAEAASDLQRRLGAGDRGRLAEYLDAVRDVERRIQQTERQNSLDPLVFERPLGIPPTFPEHARLMIDLQVLAYQSDITRVTTFMLGRELTGRSYPEIGIPDAHHPTSHHQNDPDKLAKLTRINTHCVQQLAHFLDRLQSTQDGDGRLLDHVTILCGAGMSDGNSHAPNNLPVLVVGGSAYRPTGIHVRVPAETPIGNLHVTMLERLGVRLDHFGNSTGSLMGL
jgi:uncharacterized protein DUF1552